MGGPALTAVPKKSGRLRAGFGPDQIEETSSPAQPVLWDWIAASAARRGELFVVTTLSFWRVKISS